MALDNRDQISAMKSYYMDSISEIESEYAALVDADAIGTLMQFGWFPDFDMVPMQLRLLAKAFKQDSVQSQFAHSKLCSRFRERLAIIEGDVGGHPHVITGGHAK
ncbi:MAG: hypothetical protein OXP37_00305 [Chloroflexota bacterium]|nr:hypothetical protein [Chloroflexota bacterium]